MTAEICPLIYDRILPGDREPDHVRCTYIEGHNARCSWETLRVTDELEREAAVPDQDRPKLVKDVVYYLSSGQWDAYLELILAAGHDRKRARRGVIGFPRRTA